VEVKVIRSRRRRRTVSAKMINDCLVVSAPLMISESSLAEIISDFKVKFEKKKIKTNWIKTGRFLKLPQPLIKIISIIN
jgi:hypothetical protein